MYEWLDVGMARFALTLSQKERIRASISAISHAVAFS
jgi:hypothetical protein